MMRVILESPYYTGDKDTNIAYLKACIRDCLVRAEAPFAPMAMYMLTEALDEQKEEERGLAYMAGGTWIQGAQKMVVYTNYGITDKMEESVTAAVALGLSIEYRRLPTESYFESILRGVYDTIIPSAQE